jgi:hypothetical protein
MGKVALRAVFAVAAIAALAPALADAGTRSRCGLVSFAHQTSDGAFQIAARDADCSTARVVAGDSRPSRFRSGDPRYTALGFSCAGHSRQLGGHGIQVVAFECVRERSLISFLRS